MPTPVFVSACACIFVGRGKPDLERSPIIINGVAIEEKDLRLEDGDWWIDVPHGIMVEYETHYD